MLFSKRDVDALRLVCWCRYVRPAELRGIVNETELSNLLCLNLIKYHKKSGALVLTGKGAAFLSEHLGDAVPTLAQSYHDSAIQRRLRLSRLILTAYRASVNVFTAKQAELENSPSMFLSAITRERGTNPWGSTRIASLIHLGDLLCAAHYVCPGIGRIALTDELAAFSNQTSGFRDHRRALIFAGESYVDILKELEREEEPSDSKLISYGEAYRSLRLPVHLLSCDDIGSVQLKIMSVPEYRQKLTRAALRKKYTPPPKEFPECDALYDSLPFVMAVDMDLRRIDKAIDKSGGRIAVAALEAQAEAVLYERYLHTGRARVFKVSMDTVSEALGEAPVLYTPLNVQFETAKGDVINAPIIQTHRKT